MLGPLRISTGGANFVMPGVQVRQARIDEFLLRADFNTDMAAPLPSPLAVEIGTLTVTDTNAKLSQSGGQLVFAAGGAAQGNPGAWSAQLTRRAGLALLSIVAYTIAGIDVGWDSDQAVGIRDGFRTGSTFLDQGGSISHGLTISTSTPYTVAVVQRGTGFFLFLKGGIYSSWFLVWVGAVGTANHFAGVSINAGSSAASLDTFRVRDLGGPYATDFGLATQRLAGSVAAGTALTHIANCLIEFTVTTRPSASNLDFRFRRQDATNYWQVTIDSTGAFTLVEVVAGTPTQRGTAAAVVTSGHRCVIVADGSTIRGYSNNVLRWTYASATNFATATAAELTALGTSGVVSDVIGWPRVLDTTAAAILDAALA